MYLLYIIQGVVFPAMHGVWSKWAPPNESTRLTSYVISGAYVGTVIGYPMCGWLAKNYDWPSTFYVPGFIAIIWCAVWLTTIAETPGEDKSITKEELKYIIDSIGPTDDKKLSVSNYPWKQIFTSMPVWSITFSTVCENWGFFTLLTQLPTFMHDVLKFDIGKGSLLSALPYSVMAVALQFSGIFIDWVRKTNIFTTTQVRKISTCGAFFLQSICMFSAGNCETGLGSIIFLTLTAGLVSFSVTGYCVNPLDIAPQYASIILGIANTFGTIPGIVSPLLTGFIVQHQSPEEWKWVFIISSSLYFLGGLLYAIFGSGERQHWAEIKTTSKNDFVDEPLMRNNDIVPLSQCE
ncbi:Hypothetical protein CINCED_3A000784 [Cinara cedri]|uniref:Major facilitator superfamily (MFS) profile domain-containing protein n=1 Tax=Cinara cedri TaxID=506608 RepID=A0A5E4MXJ1_9HEMI|nr:Hypothetical protein CINCED_3A000784 [Cinara cedri]